MNKKVKHGTLLTIIFTLLSLLYLYPIILVFINSFKKKVYISKAPFEIPTGKMYVGLENYIRGIKQTRLIQAFGWSLFITILSVAVIILCCSMCAWYICRVKTKFTKIFYMLCLFAMIVPFQMEMFTLSKIANMLHMGNPWGLVVIYLGFGAGLSVFMFTGFMKSIPLEIEEAAMIDGCNRLQILLRIIVPLTKPALSAMVIFVFMNAWNNYLWPTIILQDKNEVTMPMLVANLKSGYSVDYGMLMLGVLICTLPTAIIFLCLQKSFANGIAGAVK